MAEDAKGPKPLDQLIDLLVYAPVGLLYEHQEVLPKLVERGKSQVQLARVLGQMAVSKGQNTVEDSVGDAVGVAASLVSRAVCELAGAIGIASGQPVKPATGGPAGADGDTVDAGETQAGEPAAEPDVESAEVGADRLVEDESVVAHEPVAEAELEEPLPIAGYDGLKARQIIPLLDELSEGQLRRIREHELASRNRKTVLAKLDRLTP